MFRKLFGAVVGLALVGTVGVSHATIIQGDFRTEADLPNFSNDGPLVHENLGAAVGAGPELTGANFVSNPSNWNGGIVHMDFDPLTNILTLDSQDGFNFETFDAWITNIVLSGSEMITGISLLTNNLTNPVIVPSLFSTGNSIHISYSGFGTNANCLSTNGTFCFTEGTATFQITTTSVPEPGTLALLGLGLAGLGVVRRRRRKSA